MPGAERSASAGRDAGTRDGERVPVEKGLESRELPSDRDHSAPGKGAAGGREHKQGGGEPPWCERCVGMTVFTKEMKERG